MNKTIKHLTQNEKELIQEYVKRDGRITLKSDEIESLLNEIDYWEYANLLMTKINIKNKEEKQQWQDIAKQEQSLRNKAAKQYDRLELKYKTLKEKYNVAVYSLCSINADLDQLDKLYQLGVMASEVLEQLNVDRELMENVNKTEGEK